MIPQKLKSTASKGLPSLLDAELLELVDRLAARHVDHVGAGREGGARFEVGVAADEDGHRPVAAVRGDPRPRGQPGERDRVQRLHLRVEDRGRCSRRPRRRRPCRCRDRRRSRPARRLRSPGSCLTLPSSTTKTRPLSCGLDGFDRAHHHVAAGQHRARLRPRVGGRLARPQRRDRDVGAAGDDAEDDERGEDLAVAATHARASAASAAAAAPRATIASASAAAKTAPRCAVRARARGRRRRARRAGCRC